VASRKRDEELARRRAERQAARDAAAAQRRGQRNAVIGSVVAVTLVAAALAGTALVGGDDDEPSDSVSAAAGAAGGPDCAYETTPDPAARKAPLPPTEAVPTDGVYAATLATDRGDVVIEMDSAEAPCTVNSLRSLAEAGYFDGTTCHRLTTEGIEVLQCGDPTGTGRGGPGYDFGPVENAPADGVYPPGTLAMARASSPDSNGSQFFIVYKETRLPTDGGGYTVFGKVLSGLDVVEKVAAGGSKPAGDGAPVRPISIVSATVAPA
jgi:peptidyl-prolyl cis-trans isomerase B (cyclophilin B)